MLVRGCRSVNAALLLAIVAAVGSPADLYQSYTRHGAQALLSSGQVARGGASGSPSIGDASQAATLDSQPVAPAPEAVPPAGPTFQLDGGFERRLDRFLYRFENPSTFSTPEMVEHFFQQRYEADNHWFVVRAGYRSSPTRRWSAEVGLTPQIATFGEDLDTFFNPGDNVIVAGTSGEVYMRSTRTAGWFERPRRSGLIERIGYSYRRDRSNFRTPERKIVTMSNPPSVQETITLDHETTISQVHQVWVGWTKRRALSPRWRISGDVDAAPGTFARLNTILPEKYPGQNIVFWASGFELAGRVTISRDGRWPIEASADLGRTFTYLPSARFIRNSLGMSIRVGFAQ